MVVSVFLMHRGRPGILLLRQSFIFHDSWQKELSNFPQNFHLEEILTSWCLFQFQIWMKRQYNESFSWVGNLRVVLIFSWEIMLGRVKQFSQNQSVLPHTLHNSWRAVVSGLLTYYFAFQVMVLIWLMYLFTSVISTFDLISRQRCCWCAILLSWALHKSRLATSLTIQKSFLKHMKWRWTDSALTFASDVLK